MLYPLSYGGPGLPEVTRARGRPLGRLTPSDPCASGSMGRASVVLVVDDDDVIRQLICVNLELEGFEVATAVDGQDCLDEVKSVDPQVITLDIMMPRLDGWEAAEQLRADPETADIKVVLLSARAQEADLQRGTALGVDAYLTKPFDPDELVADDPPAAGPAAHLTAADPTSGRQPVGAGARGSRCRPCPRCRRCRPRPARAWCPGSAGRP